MDVDINSRIGVHFKPVDTLFINCTSNFTYSLTNLTCEQTEITSLINTLIISRWGNPEQFIEGSINGTLYENRKTAFSCSNSIAKPFVVEFRLKRLQ